MVRGVVGVLALSAACGVDPAPVPTPVPIMQIVAHEDDDVLFMNPDLENTLAAGVVTVVTTAGEADGTVSLSTAGCASVPREGRFVFAHHREDGMRAAYAHMAKLPDSWHRGAFVAGDRTLELDVLDGAPQIQLVFMNLPDGGDPELERSGGCGGFLTCLFDRIGDPSYPTMPPVVTEPPDGEIPTESDLGIPSYAYRRELVIADLVALLDAFRPRLIRTLDPQPYQRYTLDDQGNPHYDVSFDNLDHTYTARFVNEALQSYSATDFQTLYYQGYSVADYRPNLSADAHQRKSDTFDAYMGDASDPHDSNALYFTCAQTQGGVYTGYLGWLSGTVERYPGSTTWMTSTPDGLAAFAIIDRQLAWWTELAGTWTGPTLLGGGPLVSSVTSVTRAGDLVVLALQLPDTGDHLAIIYNTRIAATGAWTGWVSLGNPDDGSVSTDACSGAPGPGTWLGTPAAAIDGSGNLVVFARDSCGHVSVRSEIGGVFESTWSHLSLPVAFDAVDDLAAITASDGRVHVFAATLQGFIAHWIQTAPGVFAADTGGFPVGVSLGVASPPTVTQNHDGRLEVFWRAEHTGDVMTTYELAGGWSAPLDLGGPGGTGPIAAIRRSSGHIMIFARDDSGNVSANWQRAVDADLGTTWTELHVQVPTFPSAATDARGRVVLGVVGVDGNLGVVREADDVGSFGP